MIGNKPVVYLFFNRPKCVEITFPLIKKYKPKNLYLIADGPRNSKDNELCLQCRAFVEENIDWNCNLTKIYSQTNLGLAKRTISGIDKVFENEEEIIFLEDDNLVDESFFNFCDELLEKYRNEPKIAHIGGCNFYEGAIPKNYEFSYIFTARFAAWGFATWKRAWKNMDLAMPEWQNEDKNAFLKNWCISNKHIMGMKAVFNQHCMNNDPWAWSYAWTYACWANNSLGIIPSKNLVSNIGFGPDATNTSFTHNNYFGFPEKRYHFTKIHHPNEITRCFEFDKKYFQLEKGTLVRKFQNMIKSLLG